ncbi:sulfite exporter TauE/SafE family protein [Thiofilum flexile]|uniref:sulfite exporter TauE/SafE family protein n=1 Tax=Thiofilum flexile TaxID=125627 RepID=UPI0003730A4E|nr:sulfite exporter TauE/SafE family protein [Thiofilum flexile]
MLIDDPLFYLLAIPAILIAGISKGGFGGGLGVVSVPLMALAIDPVVAAAIMLPILCSMDLMGLKAYWQRWNIEQIKIIVPAAMIGIALGTLTAQYLRASDVKLLVGLIAVGFALYHWLKPYLLPHIQAAQTSATKGRFWAMIAGFTSFIAHAGGPPISVYLLPLKLPRTEYQATSILFFTLVNYIKLIPYTSMGQFSTTNIMTSLVLLPLAFLGMKLGFILHHRVSDTLFYRVAYILLFITGSKLLWDGVAGFL